MPEVDQQGFQVGMYVIHVDEFGGQDEQKEDGKPELVGAHLAEYKHECHCEEEQRRFVNFAYGQIAFELLEYKAVYLVDKEGEDDKNQRDKMRSFNTEHVHFICR
jgi:hypothetical protein